MEIAQGPSLLTEVAWVQGTRKGWETESSSDTSASVAFQKGLACEGC